MLLTVNAALSSDMHMCLGCCKAYKTLMLSAKVLIDMFMLQQFTGLLSRQAQIGSLFCRKCPPSTRLNLMSYPEWYIWLIKF